MIKFYLLVLSLSSVQLFAQQNNPGTHRQKAITLRRFLDQNHYQPLKWNDSASALLYNKWMEELDDEKLFFTQQDINLLIPYKDKLDDELTGKIPVAPGTDFFSRSSNLYKAALQRTDSIIQLILAKPLDFSKPDNIAWPFSNHALNNAELIQRWQKLMKWRMLQFIADKLTDEGKTINEVLPADFTKLEVTAREKTKKRERADISGLLRTPERYNAEMQDDYLNAIAWCYDPHTSYMSIKERDEFQMATSAAEYSSGLDLEENEKGEIVISFLQPGGSAWRSGQLHTGDLLIKVKADGVEKNIADMEDDGELTELLSGRSRSDVEVTVRTAAGEIKTVKLVKEKISAEESIVKSYVLHGSKNIGYINLPGFYSREEETISDERDIKYDGCANDVSKEIVKLRKDTISGLILDLRYNGGGSMWEAMQLAGIFIDIGPVASVKDATGKISFLKDPNRGTIYDGPLMVLINGASASASEFVSAVLQDYNRALIVGGTTYGKGTAQVVLPVDTVSFSKTKNYEDFAKVTQRKFYRVNGSTTQWKGVVPDIFLPDLYADESFKEKGNSSALQPDNSKAGIYQALPVLPVQALRSKSEQRVAGQAYFTTINEFSNWLKDYKSGRIIPLQWAPYSAHYKKSAEMFKLLSREGAAGADVIRVSNNGFDNQRIVLSTQHSREVNDTYLKNVQNDITVTEAYRIMMDWINK
jgi:carboxyl-terminal processing protease